MTDLCKRTVRYFQDSSTTKATTKNESVNHTANLSLSLPIGVQC